MSCQQKIAYIGLNEGSVSIRTLPEEIIRKFIGGRGVNSYLLYHHLPAGINPLGADNVLIIGAGALTGMKGVTTARVTISGKSPESGLLGDANIGGHFGAALKKAGLSYLVVSGVSSKPVTILVREGKVTIEDAKELWGRDAIESGELIKKRYGEPAQALTIGQAGEKKVRFACVMHGKKNAAGRTGMGCLMGAKGLKAVVAVGSKDEIAPAFPEEFKSATRELYKKINDEAIIPVLKEHGTAHLYEIINNAIGMGRAYNGLSSAFPDNKDIEPERLSEHYYTGKAPCFSCGIACKHSYKIKEGPFAGVENEGPEYGIIGHFGPMLGIGRLETILKINDLINRYGLDASSTGNLIACAIELFQKGVIDEKTTGGINLDWGAEEAIIELIEKIALREGFGDVLAGGAKELSQLWKEFSDVISWVKYLPQSDPADLRYMKAYALGDAVATRGADHLRSRPTWEAFAFPEEQLKEIYGGPVSSDYLSYEGKGRVIWWWESYVALFDALGMCKLLAFHCLPGVFDFEVFSQLIKWGTGIDFTAQEVFEVGERITTIERMFITQEGVGRKDDFPPERYFKPLERTEGVDESLKDMKLDRESFNTMLDEYYTLHGWDVATGVPLPETVAKLGLDQEALITSGAEVSSAG
jgi:aldehyde:ferredoxin oxidoreductase